MISSGIEPSGELKVSVLCDSKEFCNCEKPYQIDCGYFAFCFACHCVIDKFKTGEPNKKIKKYTLSIYPDESLYWKEQGGDKVTLLKTQEN